MAESETKAELVAAALQVIETHGVEGATVRRIAASARANLAAVNYHFGSKEKLLDAALAAALHEGMAKAIGELKAAITSAGGNIKLGTTRFFSEYLATAFLWPRIGYAMLHSALSTQAYDSPTIVQVRMVASEFLAIVAPAMPHRTEVEKRVAVLHVWATILQLATLPVLFEPLVPAADLPAVLVGRFSETLFGPD